VKPKVTHGLRGLAPTSLYRAAGARRASSVQRARIGLSVLTGAGLTALGATGHAQPESLLIQGSNGDGMDTHLFRPAVDSKGFFAVNGTDIVPEQNVCFGLVLDYGRRLLRTHPARTNAGSNALIDDSFQGTFLGSYGIGSVASIGVGLPFILMNGAPVNEVGPTGSLYSTQGLDSQKLATVMLSGKVRLLRVEKGLGAAGIVQAGIPVGGAEQNLGADPGFWYWPRLALEVWLTREGSLRLGIEGGYRGHTGNNPRFGLDSAGLPQLEEGPFEYGNLGTFGGGLSWRAAQYVDLVAETYATYLLAAGADSGQKLSQEVVGGIKLRVEGNSYMMMGAGSRAFSTGFEAADLRMVLGFVFEPSIGDLDGDGIKDDEDQCPTEQEDRDGFQDEDGCPDPDNDGDGIPDDQDSCPDTAEDRDGNEDIDGCPEIEVTDRDGDGILDVNDRCPTKPEDMDGFQDRDGCPDLDNDRDGIPDTDDKCPNVPEDADGFEDQDGCPDTDNDRDHDQIPDARDKCPSEPETYNGFEDTDGCPDKGRVIVEGSDIIILDKVQFATNSAEILDESKPILDAVAATMKGHPEFTLVEVAGHADERGDDAHNLRLTRLRAAAVAKALAARGIEQHRLVSQGYGEYCPLEEQNTEKAWEKNRRVEFKVVKTQEGPTGVKRGCPRASAAEVKPPGAE
jgi:OOP family OmpA-OmpF porin